jgi:transposase
MGTVLSAANRHESKMVGPLLTATTIPRPKVTARRQQHIALDKAYDSVSIRGKLRRRGYVVHIPKRGASPQVSPVQRYPARRWVVERTARWQNLFRRLKIRYEVHSRNYEAFVHLANTIICFRRCRR